jgi:hypothetical protein
MSGPCSSLRKVKASTNGVGGDEQSAQTDGDHIHVVAGHRGSYPDSGTSTTGAPVEDPKPTIPDAIWEGEATTASFRTLGRMNLTKGEYLTYRKIPTRKGGHKYYFAKSVLVVDRAAFLSKDPFYKRLSKDTRDKLSLCTRTEYQRMLDAWLAIEDCLFLSTPELFVIHDGHLHRDLIRISLWAWSTMLNGRKSGIRNLTSLWKAMIANIKAAGIRAITDSPKVPAGSIWFDPLTGKIPAGRFQGPLKWLGEVYQRGVQVKLECTRLMHLASSRGLPAPRVEELSSALDTHAEIITGEPVNDPDVCKRLRQHGLAMGREIKSRIQRSTAHLSLSNSASFGTARRDGGRAVEFSQGFAKWINSPASETVSRTTVFGLPYNLVEGKPRLYTMCRDPESFLDQGTFIESDNTFDVEPDPMDYKYEDRIFGLDQITGFSMLQYAIEEGIRVGTLEGDPYYSTTNPLRLVRDDGRAIPPFPSVKVSPIGEPGGKSRVITVAEDWLTEMLSPFGHELIAALELLREARSGLSKSAQLYEWEKRFIRLDLEGKEDEIFFLTSDLTQASEYLEHNYSNELLQGFMDGAGLASPYMDLCARLLCSPRFLEAADLPYSYLHFSTTRGCLMGDPGTKAALMLTMLAAEREALCQYLQVQPNEIQGRASEFKWRCFAAAGDDHIASGPIEYLVGIQNALEIFGARVSRDKSYISNIGSYYTEEMHFRYPPSRSYTSEENLWEIPYDNSPHVDSLKVRLLSPCAKVTLVRDDKNPAIGKGLAFAKKLSWLPKPWNSLKDLFLGRFWNRFGKFLQEQNLFVYLPKALGGVGIPIRSDTSDETLRNMVRKLPDVVVSALLRALKNSLTPHERNSLWAHSSNTTYRGITMRTMAEEQLQAVFSYFTPDSVPRSELLGHVNVEPDIWVRMTKREQERAAARSGLVSLKEAIQLFERPTYFKEVVAALPDQMKSDEAYKSYREAEKKLRSFLVETKSTLNDLGDNGNELLCIYTKARTKWFARQAFLETYAFQRAPGFIGKPVEPFNGKEYDDDLEIKSFKTRSWDRRIAELESDLRLHWAGPAPVESDYGELEDFVLSNRNSFLDLRVSDPGEEIFIQRSRIIGLCDLSTPLKPFREWVEVAKGRQVNLPESRYSPSADELRIPLRALKRNPYFVIPHTHRLRLVTYGIGICQFKCIQLHKRSCRRTAWHTCRCLGDPLVQKTLSSSDTGIRFRSRVHREIPMHRYGYLASLKGSPVHSDLFHQYGIASVGTSVDPIVWEVETSFDLPVPTSRAPTAYLFGDPDSSGSSDRALVRL